MMFFVFQADIGEVTAKYGPMTDSCSNAAEHRALPLDSDYLTSHCIVIIMNLEPELLYISKDDVFVRSEQLCQLLIRGRKSLSEEVALLTYRAHSFSKFAGVRELIIHERRAHSTFPNMSSTTVNLLILLDIIVRFGDACPHFFSPPLFFKLTP